MLIKLLMLCMILAGTFFWGYCTGHQPNSPDIYGIARDNYQKLSDECAKLKETLEKLQAANSQANPSAQGGAGTQSEMASPPSVTPEETLKVAGKTRHGMAKDQTP
jgi:hypothetical protein